MAWWESADGEIRVLIAPAQVTGGNGDGHLLSLRHPKSGTATSFLFINEGLQELHWFKQSYGSWFLGDYVCEDGGLYTSSPVDPVFLLLPIFEDARMKRGDDPGKFRQLDEIMFIDGYPGYQHLLQIAEKCMHVVCEVKEMGSTKFFRLDDSKVLAWLCAKVNRLKQTLLMLDKNYVALDDKRTLADAVSILGEYLKDEPWLEVLCRHFRLNLEDLTRKAADPCSTTPGDVLQSSAKDKGRMQSPDKKNAAKTGKQAKKVKIETDSHNIKDMFTRATRSRPKAT